MAKVDHEQTALNLIDKLAEGLQRNAFGLNADQTIEVAKIHAMLAQARSNERIADAIWSVSTSLDEIARSIPNE